MTGGQDGEMTSAYPVIPSSTHLVKEQLEQANLFLVPLDETRTWYRYHHLFRDLLHQRLMRQQNGIVHQLHQRASQ